MALSDRLVKTEPKSKFQLWLDSLTPANSAIVHGWLRDPSIPNARVVEMIRYDDEEDEFVGYPANKDTVSGWRKANQVTR